MKLFPAAIWLGVLFLRQQVEAATWYFFSLSTLEINVSPDRLGTSSDGQHPLLLRNSTR